MTEDSATKLRRVRREIEVFAHELTVIREPLEQATVTDDPVPMTILQIQRTSAALNELKIGMVSAFSILHRYESDETKIPGDKENKKRMNKERDNLRMTATSLENTYDAEKMLFNLSKYVVRLEKRVLDHPTKTHDKSLLKLDPQISEVKERLNETNLPADHDLWAQCEDLEDRIEAMQNQETTTADTKDVCKMHVKGPYKIADLVVPKFSGKIEHWVSFLGRIQSCCGSEARDR